ncbi:MAG TPA: FAD-dependent monooxygenase [Anaeromyxobacter sp.]|nr:FAD-dependent monooxygenase [Anaeromyxobacter sp.]
MGLRDAVVVGGGPAGLAFAADAAARGLEVVVLEKREGPLDKACGEGVLPAGRRALERLGALALVAPGAAAPIEELRWCDRGHELCVRLPGGGGVGIRRTALSAALRARAAAAGAELRAGAEVVEHRRERDRIVAVLADGAEVAARVLVAADGLASPVRRREGLDLPARGPARFGVRRHFAIEPWSRAVEVHFGPGVEAYLTPVGPARVGLAFLFAQERRSGEGPLALSGGRHRRPESKGERFEELLSFFPALQRRLDGARPDTAVLGAGPLARRARARVADRLVLLGDAAGYLDAVTGEGISLALGSAQDLAAILPGALARGADAAALAGYERAWRRRYRTYAAWTRLMLLLTRHPALRRGVLGLAGAQRPAFERIVAAAVG